MFNKKLIFLILSIAIITISTLIFCSHQESIDLDDKLRNVAFKLMKESADKNFLEQLFDNQQLSYPTDLLGKIYKDLIFDQLSALKNELNLRNHFIYDPIKTRSDEIHENFAKNCKEYEENGDLIKFENDFKNIGHEIVSLQKMVIRILNSKLEEKIKSSNNSLPLLDSRNAIIDHFDYLCRVYFGIPTDFLKSSIFTPLNQLFTLVQELEMTNPHYNNSTTVDNRSFSQLSTLLRRLRYIYYLFRVARFTNQVLDSLYLKPLAFQATIKLVDLLGYVRFSNPLINPLLKQLRFWLNLFSGNIKLNIFSQPKIKSKYDPNTLKDLMEKLKMKEEKQREQMEQQRIKSMLEDLKKNQHKQQQQMNTILGLLTNKTHEQSNTVVTSSPIASSTIKSSDSPSQEIVQGDTLKQLKTQRKLLNELLKELQKPFYNDTSIGQPFKQEDPPHNHKIFPIHLPDHIRNKDRTTTDLNRAQTALMNIMQNITPLINVMAQRNLVPQPTIQKSRLSLLSIVNSINSNLKETFLDSDENLFTLVHNLGNQLKNILDDIIHEIIS